MSLQSRIKKVARELAMEEMHKKHGRGGRIGLAYHGYGEGLDENYGLTEVGGRIHHRRHRSSSRGRAGIIAEGIRHRSASRHRSLSRGRGEAMVRHRSASRHLSASRGRGEAMMRHRSMSRGRGEKLHMRRRSHSRGRSLDDTYGLTTTGGLIAYGMKKQKRTRKPSSYNLFVKKVLSKHPGTPFGEIAKMWREEK